MNINNLPNELVYGVSIITKLALGKWNRCVEYAEMIGSDKMELFLGSIAASGPIWFTVCVVPNSTVSEVWCGSRLLPPEERKTDTPVLIGPLLWYSKMPRALGAWLMENRSIGTALRVRANGTGYGRGPDRNPFSPSFSSDARRFSGLRGNQGAVHARK